MQRHPLADCENCPLNDPKNGFVPTQFATGVTRLAVVGEAPGFQETAYGRPFRGPSGQLLKRVLHHHGYADSEVMFTNACLCRPPDNATPPKAAVLACSRRLYHELVESDTNDVVALGGTAASVLINDTRSITRTRVGPPRPPVYALDGSNVKRVVPTWHTAYCLRNSDAFPTLVTDIGKLRDGAILPWTEPEWSFFEDEEGALAAIAAMDVATDRVVVDIEIGFEKDVSFDHPNNYQLLCIGFAYAKRKCVVIGELALQFESVIDALRRFFRRKKLIAHNGKFDLSGLHPKFGALKLWFDTMLASYCIDERPGQHGLKVLAVEKLGAPKYDDEIHQYVPRGGNYADIPRAILYKYNALDVACTWDLYEMFAARLARDLPWPYPNREARTLRDVHDFLVAASNQLMFLELNGIKLDAAYNSELTSDFLAELLLLEGEILQVVEMATKGEVTVFNPRSPKQIKEFLARLRVSVESTDQETLERLLERAKMLGMDDLRRFCEAMLVHRRRAKLYGTFIRGIRKRMYRGRVYTTYMLHGSTSGRLASRNPNLQNVVRDKRIRKQFVASREGNVLIQCDYKQAEGRVMTYLAQDEYLRSIFQDPTQDLFTTLGCQLYGITPEELRADKEKRIRVKAFFYGLGYGREARSIADEYGFSLRDTEQRLADFRALIPGIVHWQNQVRETVLRSGVLVTPFGRRRRFHLITDQNKHSVLNEALSYLPQSTASDICLGALITLRPMLKGRGWLRMTIHDALIAETSEDRKDEVAELMRSVMLESGRQFTDYVPFDVDTSFGYSWGDL